MAENKRRGGELNRRRKKKYIYTFSSPIVIYSVTKFNITEMKGNPK